MHYQHDKLHLPISVETFCSLSMERDTRTIFIPLLASSLAYAFPMPSVLPVTTAKGKGSVKQLLMINAAKPCTEIYTPKFLLK